MTTTIDSSARLLAAKCAEHPRILTMIADGAILTARDLLIDRMTAMLRDFGQGEDVTGGDYDLALAITVLTSSFGPQVKTEITRVSLEVCDMIKRNLAAGL